MTDAAWHSREQDRFCGKVAAKSIWMSAIRDTSGSKSEAAAGLFHNYLSFHEKHSNPDKQGRWYVRRLKTFIQAIKGRKIKLPSGADIDRYL